MKGSTEKSGVSFIPAPGMIALAAPVGIYPGEEIILSRDSYLKQIDQKAEQAVTGELVVAATGRDMQFIEVADVISLANHSRVQKLIIETENANRPLVYWIVRESEVLCKHDK